MKEKKMSENLEEKTNWRVWREKCLKTLTTNDYFITYHWYSSKISFYVAMLVIKDCLVWLVWHHQLLILDLHN